MRKHAAVLVLLIALFACDDDSPAGPSVADMTGTWTGISTYPNSPFQLTLTQTGEELRGQYKDAHDSSIGLVGTQMRPTFAIVVDFGDAKLNLQGTVTNPRRAEGVMFTSALGNREYPFTMTR